ncbi:hypothetical protein NQZ68_009114 [Dissostichus eleginoides]|nr:hypothetical protein NQZ68_009114 [Dissostichus eleginoides]
MIISFSKTCSERRRGVKGIFIGQGLENRVTFIQINIDLNLIDQFDLTKLQQLVSVEFFCWSRRLPAPALPGLDPNLRSLDLLTMQTDRSRQQVPQVPESEEMSSAPSTEPEPSSPQRKDDHQEDRPCAIDSNSMLSTTANKQNVSTANLIPNYSIFIRRLFSLKPKYSKRYMDNSEQRTNVSDKKLSPKEIMIKYLKIGSRPLPSFPKHHLKDHHKQYAYSLYLWDVSVGHDCQPLHGPVSDPNLRSLDLLTMQTDRSRQQVPQVPESEEMSSAPSTEPEPSSPQREEDQQEDPPCAIDSNSGTSTTANIQNVSTANLIPITIDNEAINVSDKKSSINREMKRNLSIEETLAIPPILKKRLMDQDNQYAAEMKSGEIQMFDEVQRSDVAPHTESILCENIDETLQRRPTEVKNNDLNTHYSPRLMREGDIDPPDLNPIDQLDVNVSVGHNDCQPLHGPVSDPNLRSLDLLTMQVRRTEADNKFHKCLRVKRCLQPLPPSQNPPHPKGKKTSIRKIVPVPFILIQGHQQQLIYLMCCLQMLFQTP